MANDLCSCGKATVQALDQCFTCLSQDLKRYSSNTSDRSTSSSSDTSSPTTQIDSSGRSSHKRQPSFDRATSFPPTRPRKAAHESHRRSESAREAMVRRMSSGQICKTADERRNPHASSNHYSPLAAGFARLKQQEDRQAQAKQVKTGSGGDVDARMMFAGAP